MPPSMLPCAHSKQNDIQLKQHTNNAIVPACCTSRPSHDSSKEGKPLNLLLVTSTTSPGAAEQQRRQSVSVQLCLLMLLQKKKKRNNNMVTARLPPNRYSANICTSTSVRVQKDGGMDLQAHAYTYKHAQTLPSVVCSHAVPHLSVF